MFLIPYVAAILFLGGFVAWLFGAKIPDILTVCGFLAAGCLGLFILGCVHLIGVLISPFWSIAAPVIVIVLFALTFWRIRRG